MGHEGKGVATLKGWRERISKTEEKLKQSREIIGSEIMRDNAMSQSLHFFPRI